MSIIGKKFKDGEVFVPEVLIAARAMNRASEILKPALVKAGVQPVGKVWGRNKDTAGFGRDAQRCPCDG